MQLIGVTNEGAVGSAQSDESGTGLTSSTPPQCAIRDLPAEFNDVTGYAVRGQMATQRRRVRG